MGTSNGEIVPVILSGGSGTRLWPVSRAHYPKQLQSLHSELSLLQETAMRLTDNNFAQPLIICNHEHRFVVAEHLREINIEPEAVVLEPIGRNTAPAAVVAVTIKSLLLGFLLSDSDIFIILNHLYYMITYKKRDIFLEQQ